jgi:hypothetical protein
MDNNLNKRMMGENRRVSNGRIDIISKTQSPEISKLFELYDKIPANQCTTFRDATIGQWDESILSKAFFSNENIQIIQNGIRAGVYHKSNGQYIIAPQDCDTLKIIMRAIFLQNAENRPDNISKQIEKLNSLVLDYSVSNVYSEAQSYMKYLHDVSTLPVPISHPVMVTQKDKNTYLMPKWF